VASALYLNQAATYDGSQLISSGYQDSTSLGDIATTVRNTIGTRNVATASVTSFKAVAAANPANKYIAFPASMPNVNYASDNTQPVTRLYVPGTGTNQIFTMDISGATGKQTHYQAGIFDNSRPSNLPPMNSFSINGIQSVQAITSIGDFFKKVVKGAEKVAEMAWQWTQNAVNTVIHTAESIYTLTITSLEDAVTAVVGFFKSVVADLKKVIEWLSALFNFKNILINHNLIKSYVTNSSKTGALDQMQAWIKQEIGTLGSDNSDIDGIFAQLTGQGQSSMQNTGQTVAGQTVQSQQGPNSNPNDVYNTGGNNNATQCKLMQHKMMENGQGLSAPPPIRASRLYMPLIAQGSATIPSAIPSAMTVTDGPDSGTIISAWETFVSNRLNTIAQEFKSFPDQLHAQLDIMKGKLSDPKSMLSNGLTDLLAVLQVLADDMINLGKAIASDFLQLMDTLLAQISLWLTQTLNVSFVSRLYNALTGNDLTFLDVFALVVAVPSTILLEVIAGTPTPTALVAARLHSDVIQPLNVAVDEVGKIFLGIVNFLAAIGGALLDSYMFVWSSTAPTGDPDVIAFAAIDVAKDVINWAIGMATSLGWNTWTGKGWGYWAVQAVPMIYNFAFLFRPIPTLAQVIIDTIYGVSSIIISSVYAHFYPGSYLDAPKAKGLILAANLFAGFSYPVELAALAALAGNDGAAVGGIGKLLFDIVNAVLAFTGNVENAVNPSPSARLAAPDIEGSLVLGLA